jgi:hypothetical protein
VFHIVRKACSRLLKANVKKLCTEALAVKDGADVERLLKELRTALQEHIQLANDSLSSQAITIAVLESDKAA